MIPKVYANIPQNIVSLPNLFIQNLYAFKKRNKFIINLLNFNKFEIQNFVINS